PTRGLALVGAARSRHRGRVVGCGGRKAQCGSGSACQVDAQAAMGTAAGSVLHRLVRVLGGSDGTAGVLEHTGVGPVHPGADRSRGGVPGDVVVPALPLAEGVAFAAAAVKGRAAAAAL